jgi:hypothetical protein
MTGREVGSVESTEYPIIKEDLEEKFNRQRGGILSVLEKVKARITGRVIRGLLWLDHRVIPDPSGRD